jgi:ATP/maltotriose-dependent transcriptional regulator MalT/DNA-binding SARP family transcriptional activator
VGKRRQFAKLTAPTLPTLVPRTRLFKLLDRARQRKVVWITAIPGSGKTSLVASYLRAKRQRCLWVQLDEGDSDPATFFHYLRVAAEAASPRARTALENLTPEYLPHLTVFAQRFFAALHQRLAPHTAIVFDNYQTLHAVSPVHELIRIAATHAPQDAALFVISRSTPPPEFARTQAEQHLTTIGERVLRLTLTETTALLRLHTSKRNGKDLAAVAKRLHAATDGWLAGTVLLLMQTGGAKERSPNTSTPEVLFDYFATEVLNELDPVSRKVLLATAVLPAMTASMAQALSGEPSAGRILAGLHRAGYFTELHHEAPARYQYHPLFRQFLLSHARAGTTPEQLLAQQGEAAAMLASDGQIEAAMPLWIAARRFGDAAALVQAQAPLLIGQGRANAVIEWIEAIPEPARDAAPWLWYWLGAAYLTVRPTGARALFQRALHAFEASADRPGALLACAAVVDAIIYAWRDVPELDTWVDRLTQLVEDIGGELPPAVESVVACAVFYGLFWRRPGDARFAGWSARVERLIKSATELDMRLASAGVALVNAYINAGDIGRAERLVRRVDDTLSGGDISPFARLACFQMHAVVAYTLGEAEKSLQAATRGLEFAAECGVAFWTVPLLGARCLAQLQLGDVVAAQRTVAQMLTHSRDGVMVFRSWMLTMQSWVEHERGNLRAAHRAAEAALQLTDHEGPFPETLARFSIAQTAHALGRPAEAAKHLARLAEIARDARCPMSEIGSRFMAAQFAFAAADVPTALAELRAATRVGVASGYLDWQGRICRDDLAFLCAKALEAGIEPTYIAALVRARQLLPTPDAAHVEAWPWPIKIYSLGRFALVRDGKPVVFAGKTQKRPLDLLKVLIALGGRDIAQGQIAQMLWPQAEGDAATAAFNTTLKRLRAWLGRADAITLSAGKLAINPRVCWVDAWAFERGLRLAGSDNDATERALAAYRGPFLGAEEHSWSIPLRERLRARLLRGVRAIGSRLEDAERWAEAVELYQRGLDADDAAEELYQRLIVCHDRLGRRGEAVAAYRRCKKLLKARGGLEPSAKTEKLYERLLAS